MNKAVNTSTPKPGLLSHFFDQVFFDETIGVRFVRLIFMFLIAFGWAYLGAIWFEQVDNWQDTLFAMLRYLLAPAAAITAVFLLGARYLQDVYELPGYFAAVRYLYASLFDGPPYLFPISGFLLPSLNISNGKIDSESAEIGLLEGVGGPGWLYIGAGNAVLIESLGVSEMVAGTGMHFVPRHRHVKEIVSLDDQHWTSNPIVATTKDGIEVAVHDFQFGYRICADHRASGLLHRTTAEPYPFSAQAVRDMVYNRSVRGDGTPVPWGLAVQFRIDGVLTNFINRNLVDEVIAPISLDPRGVLSQQLSDEKLRWGVKNFLGTELTWFNVGHFEVHDKEIDKDIRKYRREVWFAQWAGSAALLLAQGKAEMISEEEGGRSETTVNMLRGIVQALDDAGLEKDELDDNLWNIVLARTAQVIESMTSVYGKLDIVEQDKGTGEENNES